MAQNSFILDDINHEAMKVPADANHQNWLPGNDFPIKTTEAFLTIAIRYHFISFYHGYKCGLNDLKEGSVKIFLYLPKMLSYHLY